MSETGDDETSHGPPPRRSPPKRKRESLVIEARTSEAGPLGAPAWSSETLAGAVGGLIGAALALAGVWLFVPRPDFAPLDRRAETADARVAALEAQTKSAAADRSALAERGAAMTEAAGDLQSKVATLEQKLAGQAQRLKAAADAEAALATRLATLEGVALRADSLRPVAADARAAKDAAAKALAAAGAPADPRLDRLAADEAEIAALRASLDKLTAPKTETRISPGAPTASANPTARAVAAMAMQSRLEAGEPLAAPLAALDRLGVEAQTLAPLRAYGETGAPTLADLARRLAQAPAPPAKPASGGVAQRLLGEVQGLVKVHKLGESRPDAADLSQVEAALAAGDLAGALQAFAKLPPAAQAAAQHWRESAEARLAAGRAAEALVGRAVADLGAGR
jgi:hypothetical protein